MEKIYITLVFVLSVFTFANAQVEKKQSILEKVNELRSKGHYCGRKYMPASDPVVWNNTLFKSSLSHAREMKRYNYFEHYSRKGESIGKRLEKFGYDWLIAGENIARGQKTIDETMKDWINSKTHCEMLLNAHVTEIAMAKVGTYRVMHFGRRG